MPLFASLAKTEAFSNQQNAKSMSMSQPGFPPTAVQFYSTKSIDLTSNSITRDGNDNANDENDHNHDKTSTSTSAPSFAPLTYQAVTIDTSTSASVSVSASTGRNDKNDGDTDSSGYSNPNLGIWNCKIHNANVSVDTNDSTNMNDNMNDNANTNMMPSELLKACLPTMNKIPTFILTLDLDEANLDQVHPIMSTMLKNIIAYCSAILERENNRVKASSTHNDGDNNGNGNSNGNGNRNGNGSEEKEEKFNSIQDILSETESLPPQGTTNLIQLKTCIFGKAPLDESSFPHTIQELELDSEGSYSHSNSHSRSFNVNIIICGIFSQKTDVTATYREKQAINLLSYHLQKYAADLNCSLCFLKHKDRDNHKDGMGDDDDDDDAHRDDDDAHNDVEGNNDGDGKGNSDQGGGNAYRPSGMSVLELGKTLYNICHFASGNDASENDDNDNDAGTSTTGGDDDVADEELAKQPRSHSQPSHYGPYDYDIDLINSVLLRGAGCPGVWNANTDSLWVALPPSSLSSSPSPSPALGQSKIDSKTVESKADQEWLSKLADSVSAYVGGGSGSDGKSIRSNMDQTVRTTRTSSNNTVVTKKKVARKKPASDSGDKKDSQDVQDFFAGLLNK